MGLERIEQLLDRHVDNEETAELRSRESPELVVGTVNVDASEFEMFTGGRDRGGECSRSGPFVRPGISFPGSVVPRLGTERYRDVRRAV